MKDFFTVTSIEDVFEFKNLFSPVSPEKIDIDDAAGRILAEDIQSDIDVPGFNRSTMDGYAVAAVSTFGASEANPAYLTLTGAIHMGEKPSEKVNPGSAVRISTGGMLPEGADSVVMLEYTSEIDDMTLEVSKSVAPGGNVISLGEDVRSGQRVLEKGIELRPQEIGLLAGLGARQVMVYKKPIIGIISTGDEIVSIESQPGPGQVRDINSYSLSSQITCAGAIPVKFGIIKDTYKELLETFKTALEQCNMVIISGGSSVGTRDLTTDVLNALTDSKILVHGIPISPGKPTILATTSGKPVWGLHGHVTSAMVVFDRIVVPFIEHIRGLDRRQEKISPMIEAFISRNISSAQGRIDYVRVRLTKTNGRITAHPVLGKSGLINTMVQADGLVEIAMNTEGIDKGTPVSVIPLTGR